MEGHMDQQPQPEEQSAAPQTPAPQQPQGALSDDFSLSISAVFKNCWRYFTENMGVILGLYALTILVSFAIFIPLMVGVLSTMEVDPITNEILEFNVGAVVAGALIGGLVSIILTSRIVASMYAAVLHIMQDGGKPTFGEAIKMGKPYTMAMIGVTLLLAIEIFIGLLLFIIPGILVMLWYFVAAPAAVDKNLGVNAAFKESARLTKGQRGAIFMIILVFIIINAVLSIIPILGQIANAIIGIVFWIVPAYIYVALKREKDGMNSSQPAPAGGVVGMPKQTTAPEAPPVSEPETPQQ